MFTVCFDEYNNKQSPTSNPMMLWPKNRHTFSGNCYTEYFCLVSIAEAVLCTCRSATEHNHIYQDVPHKRWIMHKAAYKCGQQKRYNISIEWD